MIRRVIITFSLVSFLAGGLALSATAQITTPQPTKNEVSECIKVATVKKKAALRAAKDVRRVAEAQAKDVRKSGAPDAKKTAKNLSKSARATHKDAKRAAKQAFAADRKACTQGAPRAEEERKKSMARATVAMTAQNNSGQSGVAELKEEAGKLEVKLNLSSAPKNTSQPAHIHSGTCASLGAVKYPLTSLENGKSETKLDTTLAKLKAELPLAVNAHKSTAESGVYVSYGDLSL